MKTSRAAAADGWRVAELRDLPDEWLAIGVELVRQAEAMGGRMARGNALGGYYAPEKGPKTLRRRILMRRGKPTVREMKLLKKEMKW